MYCCSCAWRYVFKTRNLLYIITNILSLLILKKKCLTVWRRLKALCIDLRAWLKTRKEMQDAPWMELQGNKGIGTNVRKCKLYTRKGTLISVAYPEHSEARWYLFSMDIKKYNAILDFMCIKLRLRIIFICFQMYYISVIYLIHLKFN